MKYILRNISKNDIILGDLRYVIPAGQSKDLLAKNSGLNPAAVEVSRQKGSIAARLGKTLIEIKQQIVNKIPIRNIEQAKGTPNLKQRIKSSVVLNNRDISDEDLKSISSNDDEALLKEFESDEGSFIIKNQE